jgi:hypothetical protein
MQITFPTRAHSRVTSCTESFRSHFGSRLPSTCRSLSASLCAAVWCHEIVCADGRSRARQPGALPGNRCRCVARQPSSFLAGQVGPSAAETSGPTPDSAETFPDSAETSGPSPDSAETSVRTPPRRQSGLRRDDRTSGACPCPWRPDRRRGTAASFRCHQDSSAVCGLRTAGQLWRGGIRGVGIRLRHSAASAAGFEVVPEAGPAANGFGCGFDVNRAM